MNSYKNSIVCGKSLKNIHSISVKQHKSFKCSNIIDGKNRVKEFYKRETVSFFQN